ncbi:hypothetical protein [Phocaeicola vulgatus]|uniref:hypothetical protein n=1 Tax=Phocaeicola vulgatus TaxID=821 RepID=UPI001F4E783A|nr:hypothetical protein [Phocaeicola vulgatus]
MSKTPLRAVEVVHHLNQCFFVPNAISLYKLDNDFNKIYDEKGNPVYNYVNPVSMT